MSQIHVPDPAKVLDGFDPASMLPPTPPNSLLGWLGLALEHAAGLQLSGAAVDAALSNPTTPRGVGAREAASLRDGSREMMWLVARTLEAYYELRDPGRGVRLDAAYDAAREYVEDEHEFGDLGSQTTYPVAARLAGVVRQVADLATTGGHDSIEIDLEAALGSALAAFAIGEDRHRLFAATG